MDQHRFYDGRQPVDDAVDMVEYQNVEMFVITDPPEFSGIDESICLVEGIDQYDVDFSITDDMNMDIAFSYECNTLL